MQGQPKETDGAIVDGVSPSVKATVFDLSNSNPVATQLVDDAGNSAYESGFGYKMYTTNGAQEGTLQDVLNYLQSALFLADTSNIIFASDYPSGATEISDSSGNVSNATATAKLEAGTVSIPHLHGFTITASGATVGGVVTATITGLASGTLYYTFGAPTGTAVMAQPLVVTFPKSLKGSAGTDVVITLPALGAGNTNAAVTIWGYLT